jgi:hypothetical protein
MRLLVVVVVMMLCLSAVAAPPGPMAERAGLRVDLLLEKPDIGMLENVVYGVTLTNNSKAAMSIYDQSQFAFAIIAPDGARYSLAAASMSTGGVRTARIFRLEPGGSQTVWMVADLTRLRAATTPGAKPEGTGGLRAGRENALAVGSYLIEVDPNFTIPPQTGMRREEGTPPPHFIGHVGKTQVAFRRVAEDYSIDPVLGPQAGLVIVRGGRTRMEKIDDGTVASTGVPKAVVKGEWPADTELRFLQKPAEAGIANRPRGALQYLRQDADGQWWLIDP